MRLHGTLSIVLLSLFAAGCGGGGGSRAGSGDGSVSVPGITLTAPAHLASGLSGAIEIAATPDAVVAAVEFQVDGIALADDLSAPYATSIDAAMYAAGQHVVRARTRSPSGTVSAWAAATVEFGSLDAPAGFTRDETFVTGLGAATAFVQASDGRFFVAIQDGTVRVVESGVLLATPFVQLADVEPIGERGLIGITLDPAFASNGRVYLHHSTTDGGTHNRISRLNAAGNVALPGSEAVLVELPRSDATNHNGGAIHFGGDGKLYVGVGDHGSGTRSQDLADPFGKLLRFNADGSIPSDNPWFTTQSGLARAVWAYGLRNPFTFAVQPGSGRIHINDVGLASWEEINLGAAGANYGWPNSEGPDNVGAGVTGPLFAYGRGPANPPGSGSGGFFIGFSIAGGTFYPSGGAFPADYYGDYFFADFVSGFVGRLDLDNGNGNGNAAYAFGRVSGNPVDMLVGTDGALYVLTRDGIVRFSAP